MTSDVVMLILQDMRTWGKKKKWCPYFLARHMITIANVVVYNYQYMLDPKVSDTSSSLFVYFIKQDPLADFTSMAQADFKGKFLH